MNALIKRLYGYALEAYGAEPDYPFSTAPTYSVLRHRDTGKWFALFMDVPGERIGLNADGKVDLLNIKCDPILSGSLRMQEGYFPAYHMNRDSWLTVLLDGSVPYEEIVPLLDMSYELTDKNNKRKKK